MDVEASLGLDFYALRSSYVGRGTPKVLARIISHSSQFFEKRKPLTNELHHTGMGIQRHLYESSCFSRRLLGIGST